MATKFTYKMRSGGKLDVGSGTRPTQTNLKKILQASGGGLGPESGLPGALPAGHLRHLQRSQRQEGAPHILQL
jgi:hypothetical protein